MLIVGGRYGSTDDGGLFYTEAEYDYAQSIGVPILSFSSESSDDGREALKRFRQKVSNGRLVNHWATGDELANPSVFSSLAMGCWIKSSSNTPGAQQLVRSFSPPGATFQRLRNFTTVIKHVSTKPQEYMRQRHTTRQLH